MTYLRKLMFLTAFVGAAGFVAAPEAQAAKSSAASKSFRSLVTGKKNSISATANGGSAFRQEILAQLNQNRFNFISTVQALQQDFRSGFLTLPEFRYGRASAVFNFQVTRRALVLTLRFGRPPMTQGF